jgi:non-specific protein-tyrosine kinase
MAGHTALRFIRRWLPLLLLGPLLGGVAGYLVVRQVPSVYEATVTLLVGQGTVSSNGGSDELRSAEQLAQTYAEAVRTRPVLEESARRVGLSLSFREVLERVRARRIPSTQLLRISAEHTDPALAASLGNTVAEVFVAKNQELQAARFATSRDSLSHLVEALQADLSTKARRVEILRDAAPSPERDSELGLLQTQLGQAQANYAQILRSYEDLRVLEARGMNTLTVIEPAVASEQAIRPNRMLIALLAGVAGLLLAAAGAGLAEYLDDALRDRQRVALATGLPTLGLVPRGEAGTSLRDPASRRLAESFRLLRSNLLASVAGGELRTILVASPAVGEGKSTTAANLAIVLAESGKRVILVDADMHRPVQMKLFGVSNRRGLSTLLLDESQAAAAIQRPTWVQNLTVVPAGPVPSDPSALLSSRRVEEVLGQLRELCDVVVVDTPPLLAQPDAALLGPRADGVLMVVDASKSRGRQAARALEMLQESGAPVLGAVLNRIPRRSMEYPAYDSYYATPPEGPNNSPHDGGQDEPPPSPVRAPRPQSALSHAASLLLGT